MAANNIAQYKYGTDLRKSLLWRHNKASVLQALVKAKHEWYSENVEQMLENWYTNVFNLPTANSFGLQVWSRILGVPLNIAIGPGNPTKPTFGFFGAQTTFTRASTAYYRTNAGVLTSAAVNVARYMGADSAGLVLEAAGTNQLTDSHTFTNTTYWTVTGATAAATVTGPDGVANSATALTATGAVITLQPVGTFATASATDTWTQSIFFQRNSALPVTAVATLGWSGSGIGSGAAFQLQYNLSTGQISLNGAGASLLQHREQSYATNWIRLAAAIQAIAAATGNKPVWTITGLTTGNVINVAYAQLENVTGMSSVMVSTTGTKGTRAADVNVGTAGKRNFDHAPFTNAAGGTVNLTIDQQRILLQLRYLQLTSRCTVPDINRVLQIAFANLGNAYVLDPGNMTYVIYIFEFAPGAQLQFLLDNLDLLPRPSGVGVQYQVVTTPHFGFSQYRANFDNAPFANIGKT